MLRLPPTRIELKGDDVKEYEAAIAKMRARAEYAASVSAAAEATHKAAAAGAAPKSKAERLGLKR